jgi:hypothetical protein
MIRWITYAGCALVFVGVLAPARRSAESSSNKSYASDDVLTRTFPFTGEGPEANDIHIKWHQHVRVVTATGDNPQDSKWTVDDKENSTDEMMLKGEKNLQAPGNLVLVLEPRILDC